MDWQLPAVAAVLLLAGLYVARASWRTWFGVSKGGCASGCGTCAKPAPEPTDGRRISLPRA